MRITTVLLPFMSKLMEKTILQSLRNHKEDNELITKCQAGFQRLKSANTMFIKLTNMDYGKVSLCAFIDVKKAFDCISYPRRLKKLHAMGIQDSASNILRSFLENRLQRTKVDKYT